MYGTEQRQSERKVHSYLEKVDESQINNLTLHLKELEEQQQTKPRASRKKEIIKVGEELNDIEIKRTIKGSINPGAGSLER